MDNWQNRWARNKYWVMARSQHLYDEGRFLAKNNNWSPDKEATFNKILRTAEALQPTQKTLANTYQHIWGYFKRTCTPEEKRTYLALLKELTPKNDQLGFFLQQMAEKYRVGYLLNSRLLKECFNRSDLI
ncbi:hypothetical protein G8J22_00641 [Lentilactobacillus hilgardii]|uniref:YbgA family protein n=1 Tax=Lentilactobacillus hilgardii TaxID=1588 RepID=UPI00019C4B20|nr:YbgA family protein [Lentilactobacillus hilgardii]EEI20221.1 hypothetical protein HMPREF0497_0941 [Lentilactobacillus buchneri ATCC 11577]MCT3396325.1 DUF1722 domain-containing protein [Lentilactobacillus hilgardii]QIR08707.1 hypothetical protein G8J22_00641 [Lentilactobacillus hilgardii]